MKNLVCYLFLFFSISSFNSFAQITLDSAGILAFGQSIVNGSDYIFEGDVINQTSYWDNDSSFIYTENTIEINRIFKGQELIVCGTINIITRGGFVGSDEFEISHNIEFGPGMKGVFFCIDNTYPYSLANNSGNSIVCESTHSTPEGAISYYYEAFNPSAYGMFVPFNTIQDVYNYIDTVDSLNLPPHQFCGREPMIQDPTAIQSAPAKISPELIEERKMEQLETRKARVDYYAKKIESMKGAVASSVEDIYYTFENPELTGSGLSRYFEYDIMVSAGSNITYLDNAVFRIGNNSNSFGTNGVASGNFTVTPGPDFTDPTYKDPQVDAWDAGPSTIGVGMHVDVNWISPNRTNLTTSPKQLLHIKQKLVLCGFDSDLSFDDQISMASVTWYTISPTTPWFGTNNSWLYDNVNWGIFNDYPLCTPIIDNFNSGTPAGVDEILTINGKNFGKNRGKGQVHFPNGENGGSSYIEYHNAVDYISWSDNEIKMYVPSYVDTMLIGSVRPTAGSGAFLVQNKWNNTGASTIAGQLNIPYSITNRISQGKKTRTNLIDQNFQGGHTFHLDTSITNNPMIEGMVRKAVKEWVCLTNVNLTIGHDTTISGYDYDGVNVIYLDSSFHGDPLGLTVLYPLPCAGPSNAPYVISRDFDIGISRDLTKLANNAWFMDTTGADVPAMQMDMYHTILHEIGHAIGLKHVNNALDLMYFSSIAGPLPGSQRIEITIDEINGGIDVRDHSNTLVLPSLCGYLTVTPQTHTSLQLPGCSIAQSSDEQNSSGNFEIKVYPNPVNETDVQVEYVLSEAMEVTYSIYNSIGQLEFGGTDKQQMGPGSHNLTIPTAKLSKGLNIIRLSLGQESALIKLVKL